MPSFRARPRTTEIEPVEAETLEEPEPLDIAPTAVEPAEPVDAVAPAFTQAEPTPPPKPRIVDVPPIPALSEIEVSPSALTALAQLKRVSPEQGTINQTLARASDPATRQHGQPP